MTFQNEILIETKDCYPFDLIEGQDEILHHFYKSTLAANIFYFRKDEKEEKDSPVIEYNYQSKQWSASRFVGETTFSYNNKNYRLRVKPRYGELFLFRMLEEIFNIKLIESKSILKKNTDFHYLIRKVISFIWLTLLGKANKHGLPRSTNTKIYKGHTVRGKIDIPKSIFSFLTANELVSRYYEKEHDDIIIQILSQAHDILIKQYSLGELSIPENALIAIQQFDAKMHHKMRISPTEYFNIKYKEIYKSFKPVVDYSWEIIQRNNNSQTMQTDNTKDGFSFFIDIAEIWELYLKSLLKKQLFAEGWTIREDKINTYQGKYYSRQLIPDIVLQKNDNVMVLDAKYKRMFGTKMDYDRIDYFQIHTYMQYYQQTKNVIAGGLLYPISDANYFENRSKSKSSSLFEAGASNTQFVADGIDLTFMDVGEKNNATTIDKFKKMELEFISRIKQLL